jgi:hypothetical protein
MRLMMMHKNDAKSEAGEKPSMELVHEMGAFIGEFVKTKRLLDGAGLLGSSHRTRLRFRDGECTTKHGPYKGENELPAATLHLKVGSREEAMGWAERYGKILGDCELELGKVTEPWDLGLVPQPPNAPLQLLLIEKADATTEGGGRSSKQKADISRLKTEMSKAGVLVKSMRLQPSKQAKRLVFRNNDLSIIDGPFAESKEMLGGFAVLDLKDFDEAIEVSRRYVRILGGTQEVDLRVVESMDDEAVT